MNKTQKALLFWTPRILSIILILFLAMFSLDVFENCYSFWECIVALFMHNIPSLFLLIILIIAWKYEVVGGVTFILIGLFYMLMVLSNANLDSDWIAIAIISTPAFLIGILFLIAWFKKKKSKKKK